MWTILTCWAGFSGREANANEDESIVALINIATDAIQPARCLTLTQYQQWLNAPLFDPRLDRCVVVNDGGRIVGYGHLRNRFSYTRINAQVYVHPAYLNQGIGTYLTQWAEARAHQFIPLAPPDQQVLLGCSIDSRHEHARELLTDQGFQLVRHFFELKIELEEQPGPPLWPEQIMPRTMITDQDELAIYQLIEETFADHWGHVPVPLAEGFPRFLQRIRNNPQHDPALWCLAVADEKLVGYALCEPTGWITHLGVHHAWRRRGIATALLKHSFAAFWQHGVRTVQLNVDATSATGALQLYEQAGMHPIHQIDVYHKELRASSHAQD